MIPILNQKDAFELDAYTISSKYLSEHQLMDNAGKNIAQFILENIHNPFNQNFVVIAGPGNNGGDGIISHYYLRHYGVKSELLLLNTNQNHNWIFDHYPIRDETILFYNKSYIFNPLTWYVDGIFGIGLSRNVEDIYKDVIEQLKDCPQIISIDIPSGIYCDTGLIAGSNVISEFTLTLGYPKLGHYFNDGLDSSGYLHILDIGFQPLSKSHQFIKLIEQDDVFYMFPQYSKNAQKYNRGKLICIAGSKGYTGAAILSVQAAYKTGIGIVKIIVPDSLNIIFENAIYEAITVPLNDDGSGILSNENISEILNEIQWADVVLFGPGLINCSSEWMAEVLKNIDVPLILDASGFHPLIEKILSIDELPMETILTPHFAEFSRIFDVDINDVIRDPISEVKKIMSVLNGRVLILKGPTSVIVTSNGSIFLMNNGTSALASAGTGDVLSGILAALIGRGCTVDEIALLGPHLHGECAQQYEKLISDDGLTAFDLTDIIPLALNVVKHVY